MSTPTGSRPVVGGAYPVRPPPVPAPTASASSGGWRRGLAGTSAPGSSTCASTGPPAAGCLPERWTEGRSMQTMELTHHRRGTRPGPAALDLVALSRRGLLEADLLTEPGERYAAAHLAALRAAAAVLAARARPMSTRPGRPRRPASAWV